MSYFLLWNKLCSLLVNYYKLVIYGINYAMIIKYKINKIVLKLSNCS